MTGHFLWDIAALFAFVALVVGGALYWKEALEIWAVLKRYSVALIVSVSMAFVVIAWCLWAFYGAGKVVANFQQENPEPPKANIEDIARDQGRNDSGTNLANKPKEDDSRLAMAGQAGDMFGGFTALFSALTFCGAIGAIVFQAGAMRASREQLILQQFEPMFLFLLQEFRRLDDRLLLRARPIDAPAAVGGAINHWERMLLHELGPLEPAHGIDKTARERQISNLYRLRIYTQNELMLGPLFRALYHVFKAIKLSNLTEHQKVRYANIARLSLNGDHLFLLTLNGLTSMGAGFKPLIEEYGILKHLFPETKPGRQAIARRPIQQIARLLYQKTATLSAPRREKIWQKFPGRRPGPLVEE